MNNLKKNKNEINVSDFETNIISQKSQKAWKTFGIIITLLLAIFLVSCIIDIYNFFYNLHPHAGYTSVALVIALILIFIIRPIIVALSTPCFTLDIVDKNNLKHLNKKNYKKLKKVANNIIKYNNNVSEESKKLIKQSIHNHRKLNETLKTIYDKEITNRPHRGCACGHDRRGRRRHLQHPRRIFRRGCQGGQYLRGHF